MALSETTTRVTVAAIGIPVAVGVVYLGGWALAVLLGAVAAACALEFYRLAERKGVKPLGPAGAGVAVLFVVLAALSAGGGPDAAGFGTLVLVAALLLGVTVIWARGVEGQPLLAWAVTLTGAIYGGATLAFGVFLRHIPGHQSMLHGAALVFAPVVLTWANDTFAYFVGRAFGKRKLIPAVSPGKTVAGAIGALGGTVLASILYSFVLGRFDTYEMSLPMAVLFGLAVSVVAQVADLVESLLKRDAGVKDSGRLLPGHGGALDRFDSLLFTLPLGYYFFRFVLGIPQPF